MSLDLFRENDEENIEKQILVDEENTEKQILVVGDGDLSFSSFLADQLDLQETKLIASVLESEEQHRTGTQYIAIKSDLFHSF